MALSKIPADLITGGLSVDPAAPADAITVDSSGNVGIGTSSPIRKLTVSQAGTAEFVLQDTTRAVDARNFRIFYDNGGLALGTLNDAGTAGTERVRIDSAGRVTMPYQPAFMAYFSSSADTTVSSGATYAFNAVKFNTGSHFNTGTSTFTAPVAGVYLFTTSIYFTNSGGNTQTMGASLKVNGTTYSGSDAVQIQRNPDQCGGVITGEAAWTLYLSANDAVVIYARTANNRIYAGHTWFGGYLIG